MIGKVRGTLEEVYQDQRQVLIDVEGIGYEVYVHQRDLAHFLTRQSGEVSVYCVLLVRQEAWEVYGFLSHEDKLVFKDLILINGVGAKMALALLGYGHAESIAQAVTNEDVQFFKHVPGVGPKLAKRLIVELAHVVKKWEKRGTLSLSSATPMDQDLLGAMIGLGYRESEIYAHIHALGKDSTFQTLDLSEKIRSVLEHMSPFKERR